MLSYSHFLCFKSYRLTVLASSQLITETLLSLSTLSHYDKKTNYRINKNKRISHAIYLCLASLQLNCSGLRSFFWQIVNYASSKIIISVNVGTSLNRYFVED